MAFSWKHVVPWTNRSEFASVYHGLYSKDISKQKEGVEKVAVWKSRALNKLSVALESTASLTEAMVQYHEVLDAGHIIGSENTLCFILSLALIRFVNHVTEKGQDKNYAQPVHKVALHFGIPAWIVRLRHDATHGSLPSLDLLVAGCQWALTYLQEVFWSRQMTDTPNPDKTKVGKRKQLQRRVGKGPKSAMSDIATLLYAYQKASHKCIQEGPESGAVNDKSAALSQLDSHLAGSGRNNVLTELIKPGHLLPTEEQLLAYKVIWKTPQVPDILISVWKSVLRSVQSRQLTSLLLQHILMTLVSQPDRASLHSKALAAWLHLILSYETANYKKFFDEQQPVVQLYKSSISFSKRLLLSTCLRITNSWTCSLLPLVGDSRLLPIKSWSKLEELNLIYRGKIHDISDPRVGDADSQGDASMGAAEEAELGKLTKSRVFSLADLDGTISKEEGNIWQFCMDPVDWAHVSLGLTPGETQQALSGSHEDEMSEKMEQDSPCGQEEEERESASWSKEDCPCLLYKIALA